MWILLVLILASYALGLLSSMAVLLWMQRRRERACVALVLALKQRQVYERAEVIPFPPRDAG